MTNVLDIKNYIVDGFEKVCDVDNGDNRRGEVYHGKFFYENINDDLMYTNHRSWVYMIVSGTTIVKIGETGNPLGIRKKDYSGQPVWSTECRLGRLAHMKCNTDGRIREELYDDCNKRIVSIWAKKCEQVPQKITINGQSKTVLCSYHKELELEYLDHIFRNIGRYPKLNVGRK
jgi:hypothetical protein